MTAVATRRTPAKPAAPRPRKRPSKKGERRGALHLVTPLLAVVLAAAGVAVVYRVFVRSVLGQKIDTTALRNSGIGHERAVEIMQRTLNGTSLASLVLVCVAIVLIGIIRRRADLAVAAGLMVAGANATSQLLKTRLPRPALDGFPMPNSFPSGHTTAATSVAFALVLVLPLAIRGLVALIGAAYASIIAVATVWAEWHRPSDTIAALLLVLAWGGLVTFGLRLRLRRRKPGPIDRPSTLATVLFVVGGALSALIAGVGLGAVVLSERVTPDLVSGRFAFLTGAAAITAGVAVVFLIWVRLAAGDQPALESSVSTARSEAVEPKPREADNDNT
ncbi:phosphatase PAP2 family protein [Actinoplanes sp. NPDC049265]|uniref:phosphatase PAP2 family protein n=1 Tax=Actinoplanes sp. NPDC049265 TaxID=3363902 RepID=UPI00371448ED